MRRLNDEFDMGVVNDFFRHHYQDRGMLKWQGFYLSDHTAVMKKEAGQVLPVVSSAMEQLEISEYLADAWNYGVEINLQLNQVDSNGVPTELHGYVKGFKDEQICLSVKDEIRLVNIDDIRTVYDM